MTASDERKRLQKLNVFTLTDQERQWLKSDEKRRRSLDKPCLNCVWAHIDGDRIFCPIVGECWKNRPLRPQRNPRKED